MNLRPITGLVLLLALSGCEYRSDKQVQEEAQLRQQVANLAADVYEAASAIEAGIPSAMPVTAIKLSASSIIHVEGCAYPPADAWVKTVQKPIPTTGARP